MKQGRFSEEQIIGILKQNEAGAPVTQLCREHGIGESTFYKWSALRGRHTHGKPIEPGCLFSVPIQHDWKGFRRSI